MTVRILVGDCRERLKELPDKSVHCAVTSPPYFGLRDYQVEGQMGLEPTPDEFVAGMVEVFREVRRVLRDDGTLWLNIGDSYSTQGGRGEAAMVESGNPTPGAKTVAIARGSTPGTKVAPGTKTKDLIGIPWMLAFALRADGWYLRQDIIWSKPNPMPESVRDRCTKAHEYLFLLSKGPRYHFDQDAIAEAVALATIDRLSQDVESQTGSERVPGKTNGPMKAVGRIPTKETKLSGDYSDGAGRNDGGGHRSGGFPHGMTRNKRSVWEVATQPFSEAHFATYPPALIEPCILAGCPQRCCSACGAPWIRKVERKPMVIDRSDRTHDKGRTRTSGTMVEPASSRTTGFEPGCACEVSSTPGTVLDPFFGAGTTGLAADRLHRNCIGIELNPEYAELAKRRIERDSGLFAQVAAQ